MYLPNFYCLGTAFQYLLFFYLGCRIQITESVVDKNPLAMKIPAVAWLFINIISFALSRALIDRYEVPVFIESTVIVIANLICTISAFYYLQQIGEKVLWKENKLFSNLSKCTMPMYLFHQQLIYLSIIILNGRVNPYVNAMANFAFAMTIAYSLSRIVLHFKYTRILIGEKK